MHQSGLRRTLEKTLSRSSLSVFSKRCRSHMVRGHRSHRWPDQGPGSPKGKSIFEPRTHIPGTMVFGRVSTFAPFSLPIHIIELYFKYGANTNYLKPQFRCVLVVLPTCSSARCFFHYHFSQLISYLTAHSFLVVGFYSFSNFEVATVIHQLMLHPKCNYCFRHFFTTR